MNIDINKLSPEWSMQLRNSQFAGELVLHEDDLWEIAQVVRKYILSEHLSEPIKTAFFVLAINCMYYNHDEEGFWVHFCELFSVANNAQAQTWFGNIIENRLLFFNFINKVRNGPFRFVSPLKEQCGITRQEISRFANFLRDLSQNYGWPGILSIQRTSLNDFITSRIATGHLCRFLLAGEGWNFIRDVVRSVTQYQRNVLTLNDLETLKGYRSGFFKELLNAFGRSPKEGNKKVYTPPVPRLIFSPEFRQIMMLFDQNAVHKYMYKLDDEQVTKALMACNESVFCELLFGERCDSTGEWYEWSIPSWNPQRQPVALFHVERGFISNIRQIVTGQYYCLAPASFAPPKDLHISSYGMVDLPLSNLDYDAWLIDLDQSNDLSWAGFSKKNNGITKSFISWGSNSRSLPGAIELEHVFLGNPPILHLNFPQLFLSNTVGLFLNNDSKSQRLVVQSDEETITLNVPTPSSGRIWVEPISRMQEYSGSDVLDELSFIVIPDCELLWPTGLFRLKDTPVVRLVTSAPDISLSINDSVYIDEDKREWKISSNVEVIQGQIKFNDITINLASRVFRAFIRKETDLFTSYLGREDFINSTNLIIGGAAGTKIDIGIFNGESITKLFNLNKFNKAGEFRCSTMAFQDALHRFQSPAGIFTVSDRENPIQTETRFFDIKLFLEWLSITDSDNYPAWHTVLPRNARDLINTLVKLKHYDQRELDIRLIEIQSPDVLRSFAKLLFICAAIYDGTEIQGSHGHDNRAELLADIQDEYPLATDALNWYISASNYCKADYTIKITAESLIQEYNALQWHPPFHRWRVVIESMLIHIKADRDVVPLVEEWREDVIKSYRPRYQSKIARKKYGRDLTESWIAYYSKNYKRAINMSKRLISNTASPIVDLAVILQRVCLLRLAYFESQPEYSFKSSNTKLACFTQNFLTFVRLPVISVYPKKELSSLLELVPYLPLSNEDRSILNLLLVGREINKLVDKTDWLSCYFGLLIAQMIGEDNGAAEIALKLNQIREKIPPSPDKESIIYKLEKCL